jgi:hypothetical protein
MLPPSEVPEDLVALGETLRRRAASGASQGELIEWLLAVCADVGIRLHHDQFDPADFADEPATPAAPGSGEGGGGGGDDEAARPATPPESKPEGETAGEAEAEAAAAAAPAKPRGQRSHRRRRLPCHYDEDGNLFVHFGDAALRPQEPPAGARFGHLRVRSGGGPFIGRVFLSADGREPRARGGSALRGECNGAILDARTWEWLVVPSRAFAPRPPPRAVDEALAAPGDAKRTGAYDVIQVSDGTVINLYRWAHPARGPIWCIGTGKGYDVSPLLWMGGETYAELVHGLLAAVPGFAAATGLALRHDFLCPGDTRLAFDRLDPARSYTLGFRHHNFHPKASDPPGIWNIQTGVRATGLPSYDPAHGLPGVPGQLHYTRAELLALLGAPLSYAALRDGCAGALDDARAGRPSAVLPDRDFAGLRVAPHNYGFILRARDPAAAPAAADVLIRSPLLREIRRLVYQRPPVRDRPRVTAETRLDYRALRAFLVPPDRELFAALLPGAARARFARYDEFVASVVRAIIELMRRDAMPAALPSSAAAAAAPRRSVVRDFALRMLAHIRRTSGELSAFNTDTASIVRDFVVNPVYVFIYLQAIGRVRGGAARGGAPAGGGGGKADGDDGAPAADADADAAGAAGAGKSGDAGESGAATEATEAAGAGESGAAAEAAETGEPADAW